jgi:hypothetical protein
MRIPFCENCKDLYKIKVAFEGEEGEIDCDKCIYDRLSRQLKEGILCKLLDLRQGKKIQLLDHWHAIGNDEINYSFKHGVVQKYQRHYDNGNIIGYTIDILMNDYYQELNEFDNCLIFTEADANWHDKLYENMKVIVYE